MKLEKKAPFEVTLDNGEKVHVTYEPDLHHHLAFRGNISETGYRSVFAFPFDSHPSLDEVKKLAWGMAQELYDMNPAKYGTTQALI